MRSMFSQLIPMRAMALLMVILIALPAMASTANAAAPAESFVEQNIQKGLRILNDRTVPDAERSKLFREFLLSLTDMKRIAEFTMGAARRTASDADKAAFTEVFKDFAIAIYETQLSKYSNQTLRITGSTPTGRGDTIVQTTLVDPNASSKQPLQVAFRVSETNGKMVVIDVSVLGIWLAIEERDQFSAFLGDNNNSVPALIGHLKQLTRDIRGGASGLPDKKK